MWVVDVKLNTPEEVLNPLVAGCVAIDEILVPVANGELKFGHKEMCKKL